jgi:hypothetical protein
METSTKPFSLRQSLKTFKDYLRMLFKNWWIIALVSLLFGIRNYILAKSNDVDYLASQSFMVKEDEGSGSLFSNILGQFGLKGGGRKGDYNLDKLMEISKSKKIMTRTLFERCEINKKNDLLINHIIEIYELSKTWDSELADFQGFNSTKASSKKRAEGPFKRHEHKAINEVYKLILGYGGQSGKMGINYSDESGIIYLNFLTRNEELSKAMTGLLYDNLSEFYINQAKEKQEITLDKLEEKRDSLHSILVSKEFELAKLTDQGYGVIMQQDKVVKSRLTSEIFLVNTMYSELIKNVENAAFSLKNSTPIFQTIDQPQFPLQIIAKPTIISVLKGLIIGGLLAIAILVGRRLFILELEKSE